MISDSVSAISAGVRVTWPSDIANDSGSDVLVSKLPFTYNDNSVPLTTATRCDQSLIDVLPVISVQVIPSKIENFGTPCGGMMLFIESMNEFSFDSTVNSAEPEV